MASTVTAANQRRGSVGPHYGQFQARVSAGMDPVTGERIILHETVATERETEKALTRLRPREWPDAVRVPLPMLVDEKATPLRILRLLADAV